MSSLSTRLVRAALPMVLLALASCSGDLSTARSPQMDLAAARQRWAQSGAASYQITVSRGCNCLDETTGRVIVTVRDGQVESRRYEHTGADVPAWAAQWFPTVDGLFDIVDAALEAHDETVDVVYDASRGFPVSIRTDESATMTDDDHYYGAWDFVVR